MKIYSYSKVKDSAWGGGNQFLKALQFELKRQNACAETIREADTVIFNGYREMWALVRFWIFHRPQKRVYRLGPILSLHRRGLRWKIIDRQVVWVANLFADLVVFQSDWSYRQALRLGFSPMKRFVIIHNAVDGSIFFKKKWRDMPASDPIKLIYTSWSANVKKGFGYLSFLDKNLDFNKYQFTFIGNSPVSFENIKIEASVPSKDLAERLRAHDIFISPVEDDACSNALLEGLACGLPVVATNSGGNAEIVGEAGVLFNDKKELITLVDKVAGNLKFYYDLISTRTISEAAKEYIEAIKKL